MILLGKLLSGLFRWTGALLVWIVGGIGAIITLFGVSGVYFAEYDIQNFFLIGLGLIIVMGSVFVQNKLTGI